MKNKSLKNLAEKAKRMTDCLFSECFPLYRTKKGIFPKRAKGVVLSTLKCVLPRRDAKTVTEKFFRHMPVLLSETEADKKAALSGDPALSGEEEYCLAYPSFFAVTVYRFAHCLDGFGVPLLPRIMTEYAHRETGIDLHPSAKIGKGFFIDHGTGVVVGATAEIGENVRLYHGVTLGAKSLPIGKRADEQTKKRHPSVGNGVVIYAGATILGGDTFVGDGAIIGGGTFVTRSVGAGETVKRK